jgi:RNA:NAD 2''-phosphotransferase
MAIDLERLSRTLSHALRHDPRQYGLNMDMKGWVQLDELLNALQTR